MALRESLHCKSFKWFLDKLMPNMFIPSEEHVLMRGMVKSEAEYKCLDKMNSKAGGLAGTYSCHGEGGNQVGNVTVVALGFCDSLMRFPSNGC